MPKFYYGLLAIVEASKSGRALEDMSQVDVVSSKHLLMKWLQLGQCMMELKEEIMTSILQLEHTKATGSIDADVTSILVVALSKSELSDGLGLKVEPCKTSMLGLKEVKSRIWVGMRCGLCMAWVLVGRKAVMVSLASKRLVRV